MKTEEQKLEKKKRELHDKLDQIWYITTTAKECLLFSKDLRFSKDQEVNRFLRESSHFTFIHTVLWKQCVIELAKLFSENKDTHKFNIHHFIHQLGKEGHFSALNYNEASIQSWKERITENDYKIDVVKKLRDKAYAHTDPDFDFSALETPTYREIENLIEIVEEIIHEIGSAVFSEYIKTRSLPNYDERFPRILSDCVEFKEQRMKTWFQEQRGK